jgi:hypothetical protein
MKHEFKCSICNKAKVHESEHTTGYANDGDKLICLDCCGWEDKAYMVMEGKNTLYLTKTDEDLPLSSVGLNPLKKRFYVSNWPGTYKTHCTYYRKGRHNIAGSRYDVWFTGPDSLPWHGVQYGENTQICHCKRVKKF